MTAFENVADILKRTLVWEQKLKDFYDVAEIALKKDESRRTVAALRDKLAEKLAVLQTLNPDDFGTPEWVRYAPDVKEADLIAVDSINRESSPGEIVHHIVTYQSHLRDLYRSIADRLIARNQKELFESLAAFKSEQIHECEHLNPKAD